MGLLDLIGHKYPFTDFHELNLDWCITAILQLQKAFEDFSAGNKLTLANPLQHDLTKTYAKNTIVVDSVSGTAYLSLDAVPVGVQLDNADYWLPVFDFAGYITRANKNFTDNYFSGTDRTPIPLVVDDWVVLDDVLYKVTVAMAADDLFIIGTNIVHFTVEQFLKDFITSVNQTLTNWYNQMTGTINQYKNDIDASEAAYRAQLAGDIAATTQSLQAQLTAAISGVTVDSEVINARVGEDGVTYSDLGTAIRTQIAHINTLIGNEVVYDISDRTAVKQTHLNLVNPADFGSGFYNLSGVYVPNASFYYNFVRVVPGKSYYFEHADLYLTFWDITKKFVSGFDNTGYVTGTPVTIPSGCFYACITTNNTSTAFVSEFFFRYEPYSKLVSVQDSGLGDYKAVIYKDNYIFKNVKLNLVDPNAFIDGYYGPGGTYYNNPSFKTQKVPIEPSTVYYFSGANMYLSWWDNTGAFISIFDNSGYTAGDPVTTPANAYFAGITVATANVSTAFVSPYEYKYYDPQYIRQEHLSTTYPDFKFVRSNEITPIKNNYAYAVSKLLCIGDSLTSGAYFKPPIPSGMSSGDSIDQNYPRIIGRMLNLDKSDNAGVSGISVAEWYAYEYSHYDMTDYDTFVIWLGTNGGVLGDLATDVDPYVDYNDFANTGVGNYCKIIKHIQADNPDCKIVLCNIYAITPGYSLSDSNDNIAAIAAKYGLELIDMTDFDYSVNPVAHGNYNNIHLTKTGNIMVANRIAEHINVSFHSDPLTMNYGLTPRTN